MHMIIVYIVYSLYSLHIVYIIYKLGVQCCALRHVMQL